MTNRHSLSKAHRLLTIAAIDKGRKGQECFSKWAEMVELTNIDYASQKMLPAIIHHLSDDDLSRQIMQLVKFTRLRSQSLIEFGFYLQNMLQSGSIPFAWTSGGAVLAKTNTLISSRTLDDIGFLVPSDQVESSKRILRESGLQVMQTPGFATNSLGRKCLNSSLRLRHPNGAIINLHWNTLNASSGPGSEEAQWNRTSNVTLSGRETVSISAEDIFLQVLASVGGGNEASWIMDAIRIMEDNDLDLGLLSQISKESGLWLRTQVSLIRLSAFRPDLTPRIYGVFARVLPAVDRIGFRLLGNLLYKFSRSFRISG